MSAAFDREAARYDRQVADSIAFSGLKHDFFLAAKIIELGALFARHFGETAPLLLDVGCGIGRMHPLLAPITGRLSGCDVSGESLERARAANANVDYRISGASDLPFADAAFDVTLATCVFHHVAPADRPGLLAGMVRVTRPGGLVILIEHNRWNPLTRLAVARCPFDHDAVLLDAAEARADLARQGLKSVTARHFLLLPTLAGWARRLEGIVADLPLGAQYMAWGVA